MVTNSQIADMLIKDISNPTLQTQIGNLKIDNIYSSH